jgi:predicted enzyme related to lactoylglutathione lyase
MKIDSAVFYTNDIPKVTQFYQEVIGLNLEYQQVDKYVSFLFDNGVRLGIKRAVEEREKPGAQTVFIGVEDAETAYKRYQGLGADFHKPLSFMEGYGHSFAIYDPDKNKVEFIQRAQSA